MSFAKNSPSISSFQVPAYNYFYYGFYELLSVLPIIAIVIIFNRKIMQTIKRKKREFSILAMFIYPGSGGTNSIVEGDELSFLSSKNDSLVVPTH